MATTITSSVPALISSVESRLKPYWETLEERCHENFARVISGFLAHQLSEAHFSSVTGYGHHDIGREITDDIFAHAFQAEAALVRLQFVSGTHAIACALRGALRAGDQLVSLTGAPYDTLEEVIGIRGDSPLSLTQQGIKYSELDLLTQGSLRLELTEAEEQTLQGATVAFVQRSRGYNSERPSLNIQDIQALIQTVKTLNPKLLVIVDNCYGEFVNTLEAPLVGADLIAGSLIKNPGGGIVETGGYIAGKQALVDAAADVLTAPGIGTKGGYTFQSTRTLLQGLYFAPTIVKEALKGMSLAAAVFEELGYTVSPKAFSPQADIIQIIQLQEPDKVLAFCRTLQSVSPVDSKLTPIPAVTPGYADPVIMSGGTFIFGSTIELSADAPMRPPYAVFLQGGLTYSHVRFAVQRILETLKDA